MSGTSTVDGGGASSSSLIHFQIPPSQNISVSVYSNQFETLVGSRTPRDRERERERKIQSEKIADRSSTEPWTLLSRSSSNSRNSSSSSRSSSLLSRRRRPEAASPSLRTRRRTSSKLRRWRLSNNPPSMSATLSGSLLFLFSTTGSPTTISFGLLSLAGTPLTLVMFSRSWCNVGRFFVSRVFCLMFVGLGFLVLVLIRWRKSPP